MKMIFKLLGTLIIKEFYPVLILLKEMPFVPWHAKTNFLTQACLINDKTGIAPRIFVTSCKIRVKKTSLLPEECLVKHHTLFFYQEPREVFQGIIL